MVRVKGGIATVELCYATTQAFIISICCAKENLLCENMSPVNCGIGECFYHNLLLQVSSKKT